MKLQILAVDDERHALNLLQNAIAQAEPEAEVRGFSDPLEALMEVTGRDFIPDVAFLDIEMGGMSGLELAKRLREQNSCTQIVFVTGYSHYTMEAYHVHAKGYVFKPVKPSQIREELDHLPLPPILLNKGLRVQCFGNFEVFYNGVAMRFRYGKSKELFAYLVDKKGAFVSSEELCAVLWEQKPDTFALRSYLRSLVSDLSGNLTAVGGGGILIKGRNCYAVDVTKVPCDYYSMLRRETAWVNTYTGEYMAQYSWAEVTNSFLNWKAK